MIRKPISKRSYLALGVASFATLGVLYTILSARIHAAQPNNRTVPTWTQIYQEGIRPAFIPKVETLPKADWDEEKEEVVWHDETITHQPLAWIDGSESLKRLAVGLGLAVLIAVPLGVLMGCYAVVEAYFLSPLAFLAKIAPTALLPVFLALVDTGIWLYAGLIIVGLVPTLAQTVFHAAKEDVPEELLFKARTLGATQAECVWDVIFKYILPKILEAVRLMVGPAIVYLIAAEVLVGEVGFGCRMRLVAKSLDMSLIFTYLILLGIFGWVVDRLFVWTQRRLCPWYG